MLAFFVLMSATKKLQTYETKDYLPLPVRLLQILHLVLAAYDTGDCAMTTMNQNWDERYATKNTPWDSGKPSQELQRLLAERSIAPCRVFELGCGTGTNAVFLAQQGFDVTAIDLSSLAIQQANARAQQAGVQVCFMQGDVLTLHESAESLGEPFDLVFDRGVYHVLRSVNLFGMLRTLHRVTRPESLYITLAGNANEPPHPEGGPPQVYGHDLVKELSPLFDLIQLREFYFDGVVVEGSPIRPLGWSALLRRKAI